MPGAVGAGLTRFTARFLIAGVLAGALVIGTVVAVNSAVRHEIGRIPRVDVNTVPAPEGGANYLVVGSDSRQFVETEDEAESFGDPGKETGRRSDTIMVVHVEPDAGHALVVSFPRDTWVDIPGIGNNKINAAYNSDLGGGPDTIIATLKRNFDIDINHYVEVDFVTFEAMVDSIGTVPVYIDRPMVDSEGTGFIAVKAGCFQFTGTQALAWVRTRHLKYLNPTTGRLEEDPRQDISRIERQQDFIRRLMVRVVEESLANPFKAREIADDVVDDLRVDRGFDTRAAFDLVEAFRSMSSGDTSALEFVTFPTTSGNASGTSVERPDMPSAAPYLERLRSFTSDAPPPSSVVAPSDVRVKVLNGSGRDGLAQDTMDDLVAAGFVKGGTGNDLRGRVATTEVRHSSDARDEARLVLQYVGAGAKLVGDPTLKDADVVVVLGADFTGVQTPGVAAAPAPEAGAEPSAVDAAAACR